MVQKNSHNDASSNTKIEKKVNREILISRPQVTQTTIKFG